MTESLATAAVTGLRTTAPRYLTTDEVADLLRTPAETVRYWRHVGKGPRSFKVGRRVLYDATDVETFIAEARDGEPVAS